MVSQVKRIFVFRYLRRIKRFPFTNPSWQELLAIRVLILLGLASMIFFLVWFFQPEHQGVSFLYWMLTVALLFKMLRWLHEWYHYFSVSYPKPPVSSKQPTVDMLTTFYPGEPYEMVLDTLKAMAEVRYPHTNYLCDEGNDPFLRKKCEELGVIHVTRKEKINAKAGNINNALKQATGEICVVLDPDHKPYPDFLDKVIPYFENPEIGFVQVVQAYGNQAESFIARGAAEQTYHFYGPLMMGMNSYGTAQAIGANCTFRRAALDSIGGHAPGLAEDMNTAMQLHAKGWKSIYLPEVLTRGLVPSTLSAYYQQQLKWSRGTFELLFTTYIRLFRKFTWRQKVHYFTIPLHFLNGLVTLIDILIPVLALMLAKPVWKIEVTEFFKMFLPLFLFAMLIRQYAQRWLAEKHERGMHLTGGLLRMGTWWIFLLGFICTLLRVKIPYIPTPKEGEYRNDWKLSLPNVIIALFCIAAIPIGLKLDWTPFSFSMAAFSFINAFNLLLVSAMSQQKLVYSFKLLFWSTRKPKKYYMRGKRFSIDTYQSVLNLLRKLAVPLSILIFVVAFSTQLPFFSSQPDYNLAELAPPKEKDTGGFYSGIYIPEIEKKSSLAYLDTAEKKMNNKFDIVSIYIAWGPESGAEFPDSLLKEIVKHNSIPMLTWEPWTWPFPEYRDHPDLCCEKKVLQYIVKGYFDKYLTEYALKLKALKAPVMVRFAHEFDNLAYPWSKSGGNSPEDFKKAWRYVVNHFDSLGTGNVTWVWNPWEEDSLELYYPGDEYVDWIGITNLNYGYAASNGKWYPFEDLYKPFSEKIRKYNKPVMLSEFGSTTFGGDQSAWLANAFEKIKTDYPEIKAFVFFYSNNDPHWGFTNWRPADGTTSINWTFSSQQSLQTVRKNLNEPYFSDNHYFEPGFSFTDNKTADKKQRGSKPYLTGGAQDFQLIVDGKPFYIQGIVYNAGHDWRDGNIALSRNQLEDDFTKIKEMGANTIRRYDPGIYDENILNIANEYQLKVLYGFWFEKDVDYCTDEKIMKEYEEKVLGTVKKYKDKPAVLGWTLGNEVWGLLKQNYGQPYRYKVRERYVAFIEHLAQKIHEIDPAHPVFISEEHTSQLPAAIESYRDGAPSVDVFGVNSYYTKHIRKLHEQMVTFDPTRPYLVSEFGPEGYWQMDFTPYDNYGGVLEAGGVKKASLYEQRWNEYILPNKKSNVGGIAYCWSDRMEGTATWFGITDNMGRLKPAYCTLKKLWTGKTCADAMGEVYIFAPEESLIPGKEYQFFVAVDNPGSKEYNYEWYLCKDEFVLMKNAVDIANKGRQVTVKIPDTPSNYRLYVNVYNAAGYCNSASYPVKAYRHW